ncbi:MAG: ABC transporter ATP-binding protein [Chloroflexi bacterium HGW-Chloroflexi-1]|nr:MAG: ABC transporter ATP-binding protein [Chloroflexi bacterium HGW-Chloroflexi-1]
MIDITGLTFAYTDQPPVFQDFTWHAVTGEAWAVIGPSGCGKSTLLYLIAGLRQPSAGRLLVDGQPVPRPRASSGLILQDYGLLPWATVWENVALVMRMGRFYRGKASSGEGPRPYPRLDIVPEQVNAWLTRLGIAALRDKYPSQISGGQRQRTAIARSLLQQPNLLLMDEPFSSLDALTREDLQRLTLELREETDVTIVVVTHNIEEAVYLGQRILILGRVPNTRTSVIENPAAGDPDYRGHPAYWQRCTELRAALTAG